MVVMKMHFYHGIGIETEESEDIDSGLTSHRQGMKEVRL